MSQYDYSPCPRDTILGLTRNILLFSIIIFSTFPPVLAQEEEGKQVNILDMVEEPWFANLALEVGLGPFAAIRANMTDLDGDGWLDCVLERDNVFLNRTDSNSPIGRHFAENTAQSGFILTNENGEERKSNVVIFADVDNDGDQDAFSAVYCDFLKPKADEETGEQAKDEDGNIIYANPDHGFRSRIFLNKGNATFEPLYPSGFEDNPATSCAATFLDYDLDGNLDLFVGNWYLEYGWSLMCYEDWLYKGAGDGHFKNVTFNTGIGQAAEPGYRKSAKPTYGAASGDWDSDGWTDIFTCTYGRQWNFLWHNIEGKYFEDVAEQTNYDGDAHQEGTYPDWVNREPEEPFRSNGNTFDVALADFDNDGDLDAFLGEIKHAWAGDSSDRSMLLINHGEEMGLVFYRTEDYGVIRKHTQRRWNEGDLHVGWTDFDNDMWLDLIIASSDYPDGQFLKLYRQIDRGWFEEVTDQCGFNWEGCGGISIGDIDRDGDEDILAGQSFMRLSKEHIGERERQAALFVNKVGQENNFIHIFLEGDASAGCNRDCIGARVYVTTGDITQMREIQGGAGHAGHQNPKEAHFGLGPNTMVDEIEIRWPDKEHMVSTYRYIQANQFVRIKFSRELEFIRFD
jgi:hypothetical protein